MRRISQRCLSAVAGLAAALAVAPPVSAATSTPHSRPSAQQHTETFQLVAKRTQSESTGGSGAFGSARGYVHTVPAGNTVRNLTLHITVDGPSGN
ncbi:hypothetical protein HEP87_28590 [Streptomyces sp. S1D4-11]|nr:hypothetical protein [Streptomyces sp. S1D4-11]QIY97225.1 hypothetical protein HEP87_28590 [Streptomyces sp. S1D4-11]